MRKIVVSAIGGLLLLTACSSDRTGTAAGASVVANQSNLSSSSAPATSDPAVSQPASSTPAPSHSATPPASQSTIVTPPSSTPAAVGPQQIVIRPVTAHGLVAPGFRVIKQLGSEVLCAGPTEPSRVAVDNNIAECSPSALYPVACWASAVANSTYCYVNPLSKQVIQYASHGHASATKHPGRPSPMAMVLSDGRTCSIRAGGAWAELDGHPELFGTYACGNLDVWGPANSDGISRTGSAWTVRVAPDTGHGSLQTLRVTKAYFVGNAS